MLINTGRNLIQSNNGLLTTIGFQLNKNEVIYALEGSVANAGSSINWLGDNLKLFKDLKQFEANVSSVDSSAGVHFVPAFSGLFAPRWKENATGTILGLTLHSTSTEICRALMEVNKYF